MKSQFYSYRNNGFFIEGVSLAALAKKYGTPLYVYSGSTILASFRSYTSAFESLPHLICYSMKANSSLALGALLNKNGGGVDIVSGGELKRAFQIGFDPRRIIFSGVGKTKEELSLAIQKNIRMINVESEEELKALDEVSKSLKKTAAFSLRVNPDVRAGGHPHISTGTPKNKFGVYHKNIFPLYKWAQKQKYLNPVGIQSHIGSQITEVTPYKRALAVLLNLVNELRRIGVKPEIIDLGGGLGVNYQGEKPDTPQNLADILVPALKDSGLTLFLEPGRSIVAQSGILLTKVLYRKNAANKHFVIVDAAMNDLARPALYDAYHEIVPVQKRNGSYVTADIVGPICESGDYLAKERKILMPHQGELLAVMTAGAYGFSMSSQYNSRPRPAEVLVQGSQAHLIHERENYDDLVKGESIPSYLKI
ncbi:MAG: diaminopimelate decarboxylase [Elusimicrobiota bacterium]